MITVEMQIKYREVCGEKYRERLKGFGKTRGKSVLGAETYMNATEL